MNAYEVLHLMKVASNFVEAEGRAGISEFKLQKIQTSVNIDVQVHHTWDDIVEKTDFQENFKGSMKLREVNTTIVKVPTDQNNESVAM